MNETHSSFSSGGKTYAFHDVRAALGAEAHARLPYAARVLAENLLRNLGEPGVTEDVLRALADPHVAPDAVALPLHVPRVVVPDSSGIPVLMDLAALRSAVARRGGDPARVNATVPMTFVVDHSLQVDVAASPDAEEINLKREFERNGERYRFLKWAEQAFDGLTVFPPGAGIIHQIHLEQVAAVTLLDRSRTPPVAFPDFTIGGDSHTPMVNALGVLGWGVGGIEIETVALGQSYILPKPEFVGVRLDGALADGITMTDLALTLTERLRAAGVVGAFVEFFGPAAGALTVPDRATLANMAPEYGATTGFWPVDEQTITYLRMTGRSAEHVALVEAHARAAGLFRMAGAADPIYDRVIAFDLGKVRRSIAGPGMPHIRQDTSGVAASFRERAKSVAVAKLQAPDALPEGAIGIAAITSCTNTSNPHGMIRAGLVAKAAVERGLKSAPWVKTSLAPGSRAVTTYLDRAGLLAPLEALGFARHRLRLHHLCRQIGAAQAPCRQGRGAGRPRHCGSPLGQPQFRWAHPPSGGCKLSLLARAGGRLRAGRARHHRYRQRPDRKRRRRRPRLPPRSLAGRRRSRCRCPAGRHFRSLRRHDGGKSPREGELGHARGTAWSIVRLGFRFDLHCRAAVFRYQ